MEKESNSMDMYISILLIYGKILLESNYSPTEIKYKLNNLTTFMEIQNYTFFVTQNALILINSINNDVKMINSSNTAYNFEKISLTKVAISSYFQKKITAEQLLITLKKIEKNNAYFSYPIQVLSAGMICGAMNCMINGLSWVVLVAFVIGMLVYFLYLYFQNTLKIGLLSTLIYSFIVSIIALKLFQKNIVLDSFSFTLSCLMPLLPGATLVNSIKASINGDYLSGLSLGVYAINTIMLLVIPVVMVLSGTKY